jgi:xanthine dehydrogenase accessory factor
VFDRLVVLRGGGDLGSGVALRLWRAGFRVVVLETEHPVAVRRTVALAEAVYEGSARVEELCGRRALSAEQAERVARAGDAAVLVDPAGRSLQILRPFALVDAILAKRNIGTRRDMAPLVVALGPGFCAGRDVHAVVETNRGPHLGRVIWDGGAEADTGEPAPVRGFAAGRVLRAPVAGILRAVRNIGDTVREGEVIATVTDVPIYAPFPGMVRGLARDGLAVEQGMKVGDVEPRVDPRLCYLTSDKALAVAGGVLEAVLMKLRDGIDE